MIVAFPLMSLLAALLIVPGWVWAKPHRPWSGWIFALPFAGVGLWVVLAVLGLGSQSSGNIVETLIVVVSAVIASYSLLFLSRRFNFTQAKGTAIAYAAVLAIVLFLRLFMPALSE
jgi:hypothetical protein